VGEYQFEGHILQSVIESEPITLEKYPDGHAKHCVLLSSELKYPGEHKRHLLSNMTLSLPRSASFCCEYPALQRQSSLNMASFQ